MTVILLALRWFYNILVALILIRVFCSWFIQNPYGTKWYMFIIKATEPVLSPCRRLLQRFQFGGMMVDFSPVVALLLLSVIYRVIIRILYIAL